MAKSINEKEYAKKLLRAGIISVFLYAAISSLMHPLEWTGFIPNFLRNSISQLLLIKIIAVYELMLVILLILNKYVKYVALLSALTFIGIILSNFNQLIVTFRDIGLVFMALSLFVLEK
ncbi:MAG TPA: hypothetical protein VLF63_03600 [Patescibacteria group bacterium]|nr:hypothetical protein [Patescibacteria group bacterium]